MAKHIRAYDVYSGPVSMSPGPGRKQFRPPVDPTAIGNLYLWGAFSRGREIGGLFSLKITPIERPYLALPFVLRFSSIYRIVSAALSKQARKQALLNVKFLSRTLSFKVDRRPRWG